MDSNQTDRWRIENLGKSGKQKPAHIPLGTPRGPEKAGLNLDYSGVLPISRIWLEGQVSQEWHTSQPPL